MKFKTQKCEELKKMFPKTYPLSCLKKLVLAKESNDVFIPYELEYFGQTRMSVVALRIWRFMKQFTVFAIFGTFDSFLIRCFVTWFTGGNNNSKLSLEIKRQMGLRPSKGLETRVLTFRYLVATNICFLSQIKTMGQGLGVAMAVMSQTLLKKKPLRKISRINL